MLNISTLLSKLTRRERSLVGLMIVVTLPLCLVFFVVEPLLQGRAEAARNFASAQTLHRWVQIQARDFPPVEYEALPPQGTVGLSGLEQSLVSANLRKDVSGLAARSGGGVDLRFDRVGFGHLMEWLIPIEQRFGYSLVTLSIDALPDPGDVAVSMVLEPKR